MAPLLCQILILSALAIRGSAFEWIAGYEPYTRVSDHAAIDLDQQTIDGLLKLGSIESVKGIYENGGYSQSIAKLQILNSVNLTGTTVPSGTQVMGRSTSGIQIFALLMHDLSFSSNSSEELEALVQYPSKSLANELNCRMGGLISINSEAKSGCFTEVGQLLILDPQMILNYTYNSRDDTFNGRTIQKFSLSAKEEMYTCQQNCPYSDFTKFVKYYGEFDYGDQWIQAAFEKKSTNFENGNMDFSVADRGGVEAAVQIGMKFMNIWMYVIRMMENALAICEIPCDDETCVEDSVHSWDQAVAFYSGSLEEDGVLLFAFADAMCKAFHSCGVDGSLRVGTSYTNNKVIEEFKNGQKLLFQRKCDKARESKEEIVKAMAIPLIQATLYTAYVNIYPQSQADGDGTMTNGVRSASFAATVLPIVHACNEKDATTIYENLRIYTSSSPGKHSIDFVAIKNAFEKNYQCMGVSCEAVGGVWLQGKYGINADPCTVERSMDIAPSASSIYLFLGMLLLLCCSLASIFFYRRLRNAETAEKNRSASDVLDAFEDALRLPNID